MQTPSDPDLRQRDQTTDALLGAFFLVLGVAVLAGLWFAQIGIDRAINLGAGGLLVAVGLLFVGRARHLKAR